MNKYTNIQYKYKLMNKDDIKIYRSISINLIYSVNIIMKYIKQTPESILNNFYMI